VANAQGGVIPNAEATLRALPPPARPMPNMPKHARGHGANGDGGADGAFTFANVAAGDYVL
jgi:hypothetical protein